MKIKITGMPKKLPLLYWRYRSGRVELLLKRRIGLAMLLRKQKNHNRLVRE